MKYFKEWWDSYGEFVVFVIFCLVITILGKACELIERL